MKSIKFLIIACFLALSTTACAHQYHSYDRHYESGRIVIWGDGFALDYQKGYRRPHRHHHHYHHHDYGWYSGTTCRNSWTRGNTRYFRGTRIVSANRSCVVRIPSGLQTQTYQRQPSYISGNWCIQTNITRRSIDTILVREHKFSPPINCH